MCPWNLYLHFSLLRVHDAHTCTPVRTEGGEAAILQIALSRVARLLLSELPSSLWIFLKGDLSTSYGAHIAQFVNKIWLQDALSLSFSNTLSTRPCL